jgi:hypothetical protein
VGRLGGGQAAGHQALHAPTPGLVVGAVEPEASRGSCRLEESVALLPRPEQLGADPGAFGQLTGPEVARPGVGRGLRGRLLDHSRTVQVINDHCTDS